MDLRLHLRASGLTQCLAAIPGLPREPPNYRQPDDFNYPCDSEQWIIALNIPNRYFMESAPW
jgi:hypothetical protein